eukprot:gnl/MRDRNA2_/MRDRNA2_90230_c0_seq1.p1 gnl/MRDRNA2_/MRDRNA2_90230_c0~~gnl/MRDRNA2_/MRDRNA2_90230_c0_seq1.p1  ORF type:complete len:312 (+),score=57.79 gnl/MRDRNA2_/MRDRNA2_90230_c0_seq1:135-1070(+)
MSAKRQASLDGFFKFKNALGKSGSTIDLLDHEGAPPKASETPVAGDVASPQQIKRQRVHQPEANVKAAHAQAANQLQTNSRPSNLQPATQPSAKTGWPIIDDADWEEHREPWEIAKEQGLLSGKPDCPLPQSSFPVSGPPPQSPLPVSARVSSVSKPQCPPPQSSILLPAAASSVPVVTLFLQRTYAEAILAGIKVWEGRPTNSKGVARAKAGDCVHFRVGRMKGGLIVRATVAEIRIFSTLRDMLRQVGVPALLPNGPKDIESAAAVYEAFGESYRNGGYVAWRLTNVSRVQEVGGESTATAPPQKRVHR